jgi:hypothetical protein
MLARWTAGATVVAARRLAAVPPWIRVEDAKDAKNAIAAKLNILITTRTFTTGDL